MLVEPTEIPEVLVVTPPVFGDERGFFTEAFNLAAFEQATGIRRMWVQDNHSRSGRGVLRGLHFQNPQPQGKLVRCAAGAIYDVVVDIRRSSPTFGSWVGVELSGENFRQLWVPEGFAHGFLVLSETADVLYKATDYYLPEGDRAVRWDDPTLAIDWPIQGTPVISDKDNAAPLLNDADLFA
jgi:dTDP-4-dehydrorhamnose 3,5-epimerase